MLDQDDLDDDSSLDASRFLLSSDNMQGADLRSVDPETQARLEALLEAAGVYFICNNSFVNSRYM